MATFKAKSREELIAAFRRAIDRKKEWEEFFKCMLITEKKSNMYIVVYN